MGPEVELTSCDMLRAWVWLDSLLKSSLQGKNKGRFMMLKVTLAAELSWDLDGGPTGRKEASWEPTTIIKVRNGNHLD